MYGQVVEIWSLFMKNGWNISKENLVEHMKAVHLNKKLLCIVTEYAYQMS